MYIVHKFSLMLVKKSRNKTNNSNKDNDIDKN